MFVFTFVYITHIARLTRKTIATMVTMAFTLHSHPERRLCKSQLVYTNLSSERIAYMILPFVISPVYLTLFSDMQVYTCFSGYYSPFQTRSRNRNLTTERSVNYASGFLCACPRRTAFLCPLAHLSAADRTHTGHSCSGRRLSPCGRRTSEPWPSANPVVSTPSATH
jgi:hypothetical protein